MQGFLCQFLLQTTRRLQRSMSNPIHLSRLAFLLAFLHYLGLPSTYATPRCSSLPGIGNWIKKTNDAVVKQTVVREQ